MAQPKKPRSSAGTSAGRTADSKPAADKPPSASAPPLPETDSVTATIAVVRELLSRGVMITGERLQETMDEVVRRGRMTRTDAEELIQVLIQIGRRQTQDALADIEGLVERYARRLAGLGSSFPLRGYEELTAAQVKARLKDLSPAELRKVRDYERRNANRKSVLEAIEKRLA